MKRGAEGVRRGLLPSPLADLEEREGRGLLLSHRTRTKKATTERHMQYTQKGGSVPTQATEAVGDVVRRQRGPLSSRQEKDVSPPSSI